MKGLAEILSRWAETAGRGEPATLATVVKVTGSSFRRPGARMLFPASGPPVGFVSGGCLETDLAERAGEVLRSGTPRTVVYDMRSPDDIVWGLGLGCGGEIRVLLERLAPDAPPFYLGFIGKCARRRRPAVLATLFEVDGDLPISIGDRMTLAPDGTHGGSLAYPELQSRVLDHARVALKARQSRVRSYELNAGRANVLIEYLPPAVALFVFGAGSDAQPLVQIAAELGWRVTVFDHREAFATPERFPDADALRLIDYADLGATLPSIDDRTPVIVMTHHFLHDLDLLERLVSSPAPYVGLLGPRKRTANLLEQLAERGTSPQTGRLRSLHGPAGLDIASESPEEIALSVLAEIQAVLGGRRGGFLRNRRAPLHDWVG